MFASAPMFLVSDQFAPLGSPAGVCRHVSGDDPTGQAPACTAPIVAPESAERHDTGVPAVRFAEYPGSMS